MSNINRLKDKLQHLTSIVGLAGHEDKVINYVKNSIPNHDVKVDNLGNVTVKLNTSKDEDPLRVMVFAHMDELGLIVKRIEENGFLRVERLGGIPEKSLAGQSLVIDTGEKQWQGIIGTKSHHITPENEKYSVKRVNDIYADFGFRSKKEVMDAGIRIGTPVAYSRQFFSNDSIVFSNAIDNRVGCLALLELIERLEGQHLPCELYIVFSVQEEFNLRGVLPAVRDIKPHVGITIDLTLATDTPDLEGVADIQFGAGPSIATYTFHGRGTLGGLIPNPKLVNHVRLVASENEIPLQDAAFIGMLTDASFAQLENDGIAFVDLGYPARYTHAPVESVDLHDVEKLIQLTEKLVHSFNKGFNVKRG
ncbi:putative aminopeptidase FrvX [Salirhabdus euzebyi]|uniref:Putative aminopeptidase FrvX n=1 Tax=Salirhabdus euzebyi TaxID=394506 RepID=A0A841Q815_9BACI|nr:M20/M25/M40 family metallo-hydrolase [Salirhabdus euzebyi]MBB6454591.1 putative aminopeptidase FrvX [Salirhabdus euzebyi]